MVAKVYTATIEGCQQIESLSQIRVGNKKDPTIHFDIAAIILLWYLFLVYISNKKNLVSYLYLINFTKCILTLPCNALLLDIIVLDIIFLKIT